MIDRRTPQTWSAEEDVGGSIYVRQGITQHVLSRGPEPHIQMVQVADPTHAEGGHCRCVLPPASGAQAMAVSMGLFLSWMKFLSLR
jgi:hypothetical protein